MFETHENEAREFVDEVARELDRAGNQHTAMRVLTGVLHTIRDMITVEESLHLVAQLPLYIKGIYVTGWDLRERRGIIDKIDFIQRLRAENQRTALHDFATDEMAMEKFQAVVRVLRRRVGQELIDSITAQFPVEMDK